MVSEREFKDFMAGVCTPVAVVTAMADGLPHGTTVGSLTSLSLRPPMVTVALDRRSKLLPKIQRTGRFGVNMLGAGQEDVAAAFAAPAADRFGATEWYADRDLPRLRGAPGWLVCLPKRFVEGGDHLLLLSQVTHISAVEAAPLVYGHRMFGTHSAFAWRRHIPIADKIAAFVR
jgi:flavin reductase (DIM6/NTAB) family NADH-FMN oxidoreductase RutF